MKAAKMYGPNDIRVEEMDKPKCPKGGLVLKVTAIGLCGSDLRNLSTDSRAGNYPHVYGHEVIGVIDEVSPSVSEYTVGERIYVYPGLHCLKCEACLSGHSEMCSCMKATLDRQGGFAQYMPIEADQVNSDVIFRVPEGVTSVKASLGEPLSSVYACQDNINVGFMQSVVIVGAGPIGCFHAALAKLRGASKVIMIEINDERLKKALDFGVDHIINSDKEDAIKKVMELTDGQGADHVISANPSTKAQADAILMCAKGGIVVFFGGVKKGALTEIDTNYVHYNNIWIYGHYGANSIQVKRSFELACSGIFPSEKFITHILPLEDINKGIALARSGEAMKVVLLPNGEE